MGIIGDCPAIKKSDHHFSTLLRYNLYTIKYNQDTEHFCYLRKLLHAFLLFISPRPQAITDCVCVVVTLD